MNRGRARSIEREMGYTADEFIAALPAAMRDWRVSGGPREWRICAADGAPVAVIRIEPGPDRRIGALSLPVLHVRLGLDEASEGLAVEFMRRFERGFHKGGG